MKKLICIFLATLSVAHADVLAVAKNTANGVLALTDTPCEKKGQLVAYTTSDTSNTIFGCWFTDDSRIHIVWSTGDLRSYPYEGWELTDYARKAKTKNQRNL
jgi:hypothetical protein